MTEIPAALIEEITRGRVILFLGAGASMGAKNSRGEGPLTGEGLGHTIADRFLGGEFKDRPLVSIGELAISESSLGNVQDFIADLVKELEPADFHLLLPSFQWRGIFTTNYDDVIEKAYEASVPTRIQKPLLVRSNADKLDELFREKDNVPLIKLHGCISITHDPDLPLILTTDQYVEHRKGRDRLFDILKEWGNEYPIVFIGHALQDFDLRSVLSELSKLGEARPRYYLVSPSLTAPETRLLEEKRVSLIKSTFSEFLNALNAAIPEVKRKLLSQVDKRHEEHPVQKKFTSKQMPDKSLLDFLENEVDYVYASMPMRRASPAAFYRGFELDWFPIEKKLDVRRELTDRILFDFILRSDKERKVSADFAVIKAPAGSGKTVFLRRLAWESAVDGGLLCLYLKDGGRLNYSSISDLFRFTKERVYLFVDDVGNHIAEVEELIRKARADKVQVTVIGTERTNEWNVKCERLSLYLAEQYELDYLSHDEINALLRLLEANSSLGHLAKLNEEQRVRSLVYVAGRQLLVALHEATLGKPFEDIVFDEFSNISPKIAQSIYLTVCTLNRFGIPVRAGLISRLYDVPFSEFAKRLFAPLEHVVQAQESRRFGDYVYTARHPEIASLVFSRVLNTPADRFNEYARILAELNISYSSDYQAFRRLTQGRPLLELFPDHGAVVELYKIATKISPDDPYLLHQEGLYEMHRPNGNMAVAQKLFEQAQTLDSKDTTILHSLAELAKKRAEFASTPLERERFRKEAEEIVMPLLRDRFVKKYARHTLLKVLLDRLEDAFANSDVSDREIDEMVKRIEGYIEQGLQEEVSDPYLLTFESRFKTLMNEHDRALAALERAFHANKRDAFVAIRLSKLYAARGRVADATKVLEDALAANPNEKRVHYQLALMYKEQQDFDIETVIYHLRRSFTPGDANYDTQFWYAYYCYTSGDSEKMKSAMETFAALRDAYMPYEARIMVRAYAEHGGKRGIYEGLIVRLEASHGFVRRDRTADDIFLHKNDVGNELWDTLRTEQKVRFTIGFSFNGPVVCDLQVVS